MTIELVEKEYSVQCDICGRFCENSAFVCPNEGKRKAREYFIQKGWSFNGHGEAACPECAECMASVPYADTEEE